MIFLEKRAVKTVRTVRTVRTISFVDIRMFRVPLLILSFLGSVAHAVVFGQDDRHEVYEMPAIFQELTRSVAVKVPADMVPDGGGAYSGVPLSKNYCASNRYSEQILLPPRACTAFLVKSDILVTAAHCIKMDEDLCGSTGNFRYVFDYQKRAVGDNESYLHISASQVYKCKAILARRLDNFGDVDYAIIQLDRPVLDRQPLTMEFTKRPVVGDSLFAIGYPTGLPAKVTDNGFVVEVKGEQAFGTDLDLFSGNSGSPIFDSKTLAVVAVNSNGESDWVRNGSCKMAKVCEVGKCHLSLISSIINMKDEPAIR